MTKDHTGESDLDQRTSKPTETCQTLNEIGEGRFEGKPVKNEDTSVDNIESDDWVSAIDFRTRQSYPCDVGGTSFQEAQEGTYTAIKIKQEEESDVDDYDDKPGIIGGFLEDSDVDLQIDGEHYNWELVPGYMTDNNSKVWELCLSSLTLIHLK